MLQGSPRPQAMAAAHPRHIQHPVALAALLSLLAMFGPFTIDAFFPAFHAVATDLDANAFEMQQTISLYLIGYALMALVHGPMSDRFGRRPVILFGVVAYAIASLGCALAASIEVLWLFRFLQGCTTGAGLIVGRAIIRDLYHGAQAQRILALTSMFFGIAPAVAPAIGAAVFDFAGWHAVFYMLVLYGLGLWLLCSLVLPESHPPEHRTALNPRSLLRTYQAIVADRPFVWLVMASGLHFSATFLYIASAPVFIETHLGLGTHGYPWFFIPMITGMTLGAAVSARMAGRISPRASVEWGYRIMAVSILANLGYALLWPQPAVPWAILPLALYGFGSSMAQPALNLAMLDRHASHRGSAASVQGFLWSVLLAAVSGFAAAWVSASTLWLALGAIAFFLAALTCYRMAGDAVSSERQILVTPDLPGEPAA